MVYYLIRRIEHGYELDNLTTGECNIFHHRISAIDFAINNVYDNRIDTDITILEEMRYSFTPSAYCDYYIITKEEWCSADRYRINEIGGSNPRANRFYFDSMEELQRFASNNDILLCEPLEERYYQHFLI